MANGTLLTETKTFLFMLKPKPNPSPDWPLCVEAKQRKGKQMADGYGGALEKLEKAWAERDQLQARVKELEAALRRVSKSIEDGGGGGVTCTVWMTDTPNETVCDFIGATIAQRCRGSAHSQGGR